MGEAALLLLLAVAVGVAAIAWSLRRGVTLDVGGTSWLLAAIAVVALAVLGPLDGLAHRWLWCHMVQHLVLVSVAAPLLALARLPRVATLERWRSRAGPHDGAARDDLPLAAVTAVGVLFLWHAPVLYDAALRHAPLHAAEHLTLVASAAWLWRRLLEPRHGGVSVLCLFLVMLPMTAFGVAMTFARTPWYPPYAHGSAAAALRDQQLAGVVMWSFGGLAATVAAVTMFAAWLVQADVGGVT